MKANGIEEEEEYHFIKTDEEPSSPISKSANNQLFDASAEFIDILYAIKQVEENKLQENVIPNQKYLSKKRKAVFSNPSEFFDRESFVAPRYEKSESERVKIQNALTNNMLTKKLSDDDINTLIAAFHMKTFKKDDVIIKFGDDGTEYYVLESGVLQ
jgi:hypothetical protein